jgi:cytochrome subunit of sulfide dehydrogenase
MNRRLWRQLAVTAAVAVQVPTAAWAQDSQALRSSALAATCANCHGTQGRAIGGSVVPGLAGVSANVIVEQMNAFKTGTRPATVMHQLSKGYSDAQIQQLAAYFAAQTR